ncbi:MAG: hypothetical protein NZ602_07150 [Thermoguttaceae bacterium]|nr:hypothetical protein [Thermoguttaceae bacterium]MDW8037975.1 hypothetical protein [Thermoguttaceae bacterium]
MRRGFFLPIVVGMGLLLVAACQALGAKVVVDLGKAEGVRAVGAIARWDQDGNFRRPVDPKAKIDAPQADYWATETSPGKWEFKDLPKGRYDLVILGKDRVRIEGFEFAPVLEFDPFIPGTASFPEEDAEDRDWILDHIRKSKHYENKVIPLYIARSPQDKKVARVLVMLIRDLPTSYEADFPGAATMRFEIWQYDWLYGGWAKNKRTKVMHRVILHRDELRRWTWLWDGRLGGIQVDKDPLTIQYDYTEALQSKKLQGLYPY